MGASETIKPITDEQRQELDAAFERARKALAVIETYDQARVDRLCQAVAWAVANKRTFTRLVDMGIKESGLGDYDSRMNKRMKIRGVLRDALRQKSVGIIEELPEKGIVKYGKPAFIGSWCIVLLGIAVVFYKGERIYGIDFAGGDIASVSFKERIEPEKIRAIAAENKLGEVNPAYVADLEAKGLIFSGRSPDGHLMEIAELPKNKHPFFLGTQFHPEFLAHPLRPHPLFTAFIKACMGKKK